MMMMKKETKKSRCELSKNMTQFRNEEPVEGLYHLSFTLRWYEIIEFELEIFNLQNAFDFLILSSDLNVRNSKF